MNSVGYCMLSHVRVVFCIEKYPCYDSVVERVAILGSIEDFGSWEPQRCKSAIFSGGNNWMLETFLPAGQVFFYQLLLYKNQTSEVMFDFHGDTGQKVVVGEENWVRRLDVKLSPLIVRIVYGKPDIRVAPLKSHLTPDGRPINVYVNARKTILKPHPSDVDLLAADCIWSEGKFCSTEATCVHEAMPVAVRKPFPYVRKQTSRVANDLERLLMVPDCQYMRSECDIMSTTPTFPPRCKAHQENEDTTMCTNDFANCSSKTFSGPDMDSLIPFVIGVGVASCFFVWWSKYKT
ncbi:uncharacterized protein LOC127879471 isoform X2 [Dreissena polymorpha]|uniref:uncharacterized protein LOC127879471 isoform X2 n=1 Tax=Dreissena polymorpha TaxID=45954 RepID=UPI002263CE29|nr:uncharacterized protein LOC127879471 isoform X2 [Dreissena polymorpha]